MAPWAWPISTVTAFLSSYLGVSGAFLLAPVLLYPILKITRTYQLSSLADLFAFRFRSTWAGALDHDFHVDRRAASAGSADPGGGRLHQYPHP